MVIVDRIEAEPSKTAPGVDVAIFRTPKGHFVPVECVGATYVVRAFDNVWNINPEPVVCFAVLLGRGFRSQAEAEGFALREWPALRAARPRKLIGE